MVNNPNPSGANPPPKPWERAGPPSGPAPFKPPSAGNTTEVVEASGTAKPGEVVTKANGSSAVNSNTLTKPVPARPWQQQTYGIGGYGSSMFNNYGSGLYGAGRGNGIFGSTYGGGYGGGFGGSTGGYSRGANGGQDPNNPFGPPSAPPDFWVSLMRVMEGVVGFFGRVAMLIDQNTQAFHMLMTGLLQLFDRSGMLYAELARFVLRLLGIKTKPKNTAQPLPGPQNGPGPQNSNEGPKKGQGGGGWDNVWGEK